MISEIASRVPSGGGVGLGVPIMGMGGGDGGEGGDATEDLSSDDADGFAAAEVIFILHCCKVNQVVGDRW